MTQHIERYQLSEDWTLSYEDAKSKIAQNKVWKSILRFHTFWDLQYLKLLEWFDAKTVCSCKNGPLNCQNTNTLYKFPNFKAFFLKINFSPTCYDIFNEIAIISQECNIRFQIFLDQNPKLSWKNRQKSILIFGDNWSLLMCWVTYYKICSCLVYTIYRIYILSNKFPI